MTDIQDTNGIKRTSITFIPKAARDLFWLCQEGGISLVDATNRAVQVHAFIEREAKKGKVVYLGNEDGSNMERLHIV